MTNPEYHCPKCNAPVKITEKHCFNCRTELNMDRLEDRSLKEKRVKDDSNKTKKFSLAPETKNNKKEIYRARLLDRLLALAVDGLFFGLIPPLFFLRDVIPQRGKSIGKSFFNLIVVDYDTGEPITVKQNLIRTACLFTIIDLIIPLFDKERRRLGDILANTIVLEDRGS